MNKLAIRGGPRTKTKPFPKWPQWNQRDEELLLEALRSGRWARSSQDMESFGKEGYKGYIEQLEEKVAAMQDAKYCLAVASGTAALDVAVKAIGVKPRDEVIVTAYSYVASATCVLHAGATPVFVDIERDTCNIDIDKIVSSITPRTSAIIVVHFGGVPVNMDKLVAVAKQHNIRIIEDAAHALGAAWNGRGVGAIGDIGCFSLQSSKNITCGEGGVIVTNNEEYYRRAFSLHMAGRSIGGPWYEHSELGWNYRLTEFQAALACSQLERMEEQNSLRASNAEYLRSLLKDIEGLDMAQGADESGRRVYHILSLRYAPEKWNGLSRKRFIMALNGEGIPCHEGYLYPIYRNPLFKNNHDRDYSAFADLCPVAENTCKEAIWLHQELLLGDKQDMEEIAEAVKKIKMNLSEIKR